MLSLFVLTEYLKYLAYKGQLFFGEMWVALKRAGCCASVFWLCVIQFFNNLLTSCFSQEIRLSTSLLQIQTFFIKILASSLNTTSIVGKHCSDVCCDKFLEPQIDRKNK